MIKNIWKRFWLLILMAVLLISCAPTAFASEEPIKLHSVNMNLGNELTLNIKVLKTELPEGRTYTAKVLLSETELEIPMKAWREGNDSYLISIPVAAKKMADELIIVLVDGSGKEASTTVTTSAREYLMSQLNNSTDARLKTLVVDMLNYGAEAQKYFRYNTGDLANAQLTEEQKALASAGVSFRNNAKNEVGFGGSSLSLEERIAMNLLLKEDAVSGFETTDLYAVVSFTNYLGQVKTVTIDGSEFTKRAAGGYYAELNALTLADAYQIVNVKVYSKSDAGKTAIVSGCDSIESYVARSKDAALTDLNNAIMKCANSAYEYLAEKNGVSVDGTYSVTFVDYDGTALSTQKVARGEDAIVPLAPSRDGYYFTGWSGNWQNVTANTTVWATYAAESAANIFSVDAQTNANADTISVAVGLDGAVNLGGFDIRLVYDASKVEVVSATAGTALDVLTKEYPDVGQVRAMLMETANITAGGKVMDIVFKITDGAEGMARFAIEPAAVLAAGSGGRYVAANHAACETSVELSHAYGSWQEDGDVHTHTCVGCGHAESEGHVWDEGEEAETGTVYTCTECAATTTEEISAHNWNTGELTKTPTETTAGEILYTCLDADCGETKTKSVAAGTKVYTRADLEEAIEELSWDYLLKKDKIQYDSMELDAMGKYYSGKYLVTEGAAPEYGTSHTEINSVCSDYVWKVYEEALHHNLLGVRSSLEAVTADMWYNAENQVYTSDEEDIDSTLVRWQSLAFTDIEKQYGVPDSPHFVETKEEVFEYFLNWETMLRPGDVLVDKGHALIYAGNGKVLHCNGTKYQPTTGVLNHEDSGSVNGVSPLSCEDTSWLNTRANTGRLIVWRPNEFLVTKDTDGDLSNDIVRDPDFTMPADTLSRLEYPGMEIDRTVDITPFGTASVGQELTYSIKISNLSTDSKYLAAKQVNDSTYAGVAYEDLIVTETIPEGTTLVENSITENGIYDEETNTITWNLTIKAGRAVTPAYTVEVTGEIGDTIVSDGGFVANIPSNRIENRIGGVKLNEFAENALLEIAESDTAAWNYGTDLAFAEKIYEAAETTLELPTVAEIVDNLFTWTNTLGEIRNSRYSAGKDNVDVFMLKGTVDEAYTGIRDMIINTYYGGYLFFTGSDAIGSTLSEFRLAYLEPGDIIINIDTDAGAVTASQVAVYAGNDKLMICNADGTYTVLSSTAAKLQLWKSFLASNDLFFALRPSQVADLKAAHTWDEGTVTTEPTCGSTGIMTFTCLDDGCGATKTKVLDKTTEHNWSEDAEDNGNGTHTTTCGDCGATEVGAHVWDDGVADTEDSSKTVFTCEVCGATKTEVAGLTADKIAALQKLTYSTGNMTAASNSRQRPFHFADTIYAAIGLDGLVETYNGGLTAAAILAQPFYRLDSNGSVYGAMDREYALRTYANGYITVDGAVQESANMIVDGFYGGSWIVNEDGDRLTNAAASMDINDLQPGDVIVMGENTSSGAALLWVSVYQGIMDGEHTFIYATTYYGTSYTNVPFSATTYRGKMTFDAESGTLTGIGFNNGISSTGTVVEQTMVAEIGETTFNDYLMSDLVSGINWEYFYAIRPCKVLGS